MTAKTYEVHYTNAEGKGRYFTFTTDRDFRTYRLTSNNWYGLSYVFMEEVFTAFNASDTRKQLNPNQAIKYIKCVETNERRRNQGFGIFA